MTRLIVSILIFAFGASNHLSCGETLLPCPLIWEEVTVGDFPGDVVSVNPEFHLNINLSQREDLEIKDIYIARKKYSSYVIGKVNSLTGLGYFPSGTQEKIETSFEILRNPNECTVKWLPTLSNLALAVQTSIGQNPVTHIGRGVLPIENVLSPGEIIGEFDSTEAIIRMTEDGSTLSTQEFNILLSYSEGLKLKTKNFKINDDTAVDLRPEVVGIDEIWNNSPASVVQVLEHKTTVRERTFISSSSFSSSTWGFTVGISFGVPVEPVKFSIGISYGYQKSSEEEHQNSSVNEKERQINFRREIRLPPFTSAQACSLVQLLEDYTVNYTGEFHYSAKGLELAQVKKLLEDDGITGGVIREDVEAVVVETSGQFETTMAVNTQFIVIPYDRYAEESGCSAIQRYSRKIREIKQQIRKSPGISIENDLIELKSLRNSINAIISKSFA